MSQAKGGEPLSPGATAQDGTAFWHDPVVWLLVLGALLFRVAYNLALHPDGHPISTFVIDEREYFSAAHVMAEGRGFSFYDTFVWVRPSAYVVLLGGLFALAGTAYQYLAVLVGQSALSALSLLPLARLAGKVAGRKAALWTLVLGAFFLPFTLFAGLLLSETLFVFLFAWGLLALWSGREALLAGAKRRGYALVAVAGLLLGGAALTRSTALAFLPVAAVWLAFALPRWSGAWRQAIAAGALLLVAGMATILPIAARNYAAYHRLILLDTTGAYNLLLASQGVKDEARIRSELESIPDQGERQSHALTLAWENIRRDPAAFVGKGLKESLDLWKPLLAAEENATEGYPSGRVPAWHLLSLFALDTLLYVAILVLAVVGFALSPVTALKWLTGGWVLLWVAIAFVFFAVTRFRMPVVAALLPWAGLGATLLPRVRVRWRDVPVATKAVSAVAVVGVLLVVAANVPLSDTTLGVQRWFEQAPYRDGERLLNNGNAADAVESYRKANMDVADTRYGLAAALLWTGDAQAALATLRPDESPDRYEVPIIKGQVARMKGDLNSARSFFNARVVQVNGDDALRWAWRHLKVADVSSLEVGSGLDVGYVRGFYQPEKDSSGKTYRWSTDQPEVRGFYGQLSGCQATVNLWRPGGVPPATQASRFSQGDEWVDVPSPQAVFVIHLRDYAEKPFVSSGQDPRLLGVRVSRVQCGP